MKPIPIFAIILLFSAGCSKASTLEDLLRNGTRLEWTYLRNEVRYYMTPDITADVVDSERQRFNVSYTISPRMPIDEDVPLPPSVDYLRLQKPIQMDLPRQTVPPTTTPYPSSPTTTPQPTSSTPPPTTTLPPPLPDQMRTQFQTGPSRFVAVQGETLVTASSPAQYLFLHPVAGSDNEFHLYYNNTPFVTPRTRAPFDFFLRQRFPDEPPAIFSLQPYQFHLNSSYRGNRSHILPTLIKISELRTESERISAYEELLVRMDNFAHLTGDSEIFSLGQHIVLNVASYLDTYIFASLPDQVRHIAQSNDESYRLQITYIDEDGSLIPLNEHLGLIQPATSYPFYVRPTFPNSVQSGTGFYWGINGAELVSVSTPSQLFEF
ncbi:uncharacterized protein LOC118433191 [Folsomia candida]|uniref:uncharacterized protein LOC118433191 n=1 Tax=Folsomia candida TaxID=158441 RepID=UPI001604EB24|nr:uncharacterized protein LOC118433191 [Folsomia candida]